MTIRFAAPQDFASIRRFDPHSKYLDPQRIHNKIVQKEILIAEENDTIVGLMKFSYFWATRPYIDLIYVEPKRRKQGISGLLLSFLEEYLIREGYAYLFSSAEHQDKEAQCWHEHMGFRNMGTITDLNLPHDETAEIFYSKKISDIKSLKTYQE